MDKIELAQLITDYLSITNNEERQVYAEKIMNLEANYETHIQQLLEILYDNQSQELADVKFKIAVYLRNYIYQLVVKINLQSNPELLKKLIDIFYKCLQSDQIKILLKPHINLIFENLLSIYQTTQDREMIQNYEKIIEGIKASLNSGNTETIMGSLYISQSLLLSLKNPSDLVNLFQKLSPLLTTLVENHIQQFQIDSMVLPTIQPDQLNISNPQVQKIMQNLEVVEYWTKIHQNMFERFENIKQVGYQIFVLNQNYCNAFKNMLGLHIEHPNQSNNTIMSVTGIEKLDNMLNKIKVKTMESLNILYKYLLEQIDEMKNKSQFTSIQQLIVKGCIATLLETTKSPYLDNILQEEVNSNLIIECIEFICLMTQDTKIYDIIAMYSRHLIVDVALLLLRTSSLELDQMVKDPEQFVNLALDTCDKQKSMVLKTQGAKLLESICDNVDGSVSFLTYFCCISINFAFNKQQQEDQGIQNEINAFQESKFLKSDPVIVVETCLVALTAISYILPRRNDLIPVFEQTLSNNLDNIISPNSVILQARMSLLLGYYADMIFKNSEQAFMNTINFLVNSLSLTGDKRVVALQSADTLNTIISDTDLQPRLLKILPEFIKVLNGLNLKIQIKLYFQFILEFLNNFSEHINQEIVGFLETLVQRILIELKVCHEKGEKNNIIINKCWNAIRQAAELNEFIPRFYDQIEEVMKPLFEYIVRPNEIEFEDDIVLLIKSFIKKRQTVSQVLWTVYPHLKNVFQKNNNGFGNLLDTINMYLIYGRDEMINNNQLIRVLIDMAKDAMVALTPDALTSNCEGCILIQVIFQVFKDSQAVNDYFEEIMNALLDRKTIDPMNDHLKRHINCAILTAFAYNSTAAYNYLEGKQKTQELVQELLQLQKTFQNSYERKLLAIGISCMLASQSMPQSLIQQLPQLIQLAVSILTLQIKIESKSLRKQGKREIKDNCDDDDEDDDEEIEDSDEENAHSEYEASDEERRKKKKDMTDEEEWAKEEEKEDGKKKKNDTQDSEIEEDEENDMDELFDLNVTMDLLMAPFKKIDEFNIFSLAMRELHKKDPQYIQQVVQQLSEEDKKFLKQHIETKRIQIEHKGIQSSVARRIIKVKRKGETN